MSRDRSSALIFLAFSLAYGALAFQIELFPGSEFELFTARTLPIGLAVAGTVVSFLMVILSRGTDQDKESLAGLNWTKVLALCALMAVFGATITRLGFVSATSLFLVGGFLLLGERRWYVVLGLALSVALGFWVILSKLLGIYLEPGFLF